MMEEYAAELCGARYVRDDGKDAYRWGQTKGKLGFHGGKIELQRPRVRDRAGGEIALPNSHAAMAEDWLGKWALILMLINVSTRKFGRAARLPEGAVPAQNGAGVSKSAASRRFVALSAERMAEWMSSDISKLDLLVIQIDGIYIAEDPNQRRPLARRLPLIRQQQPVEPIPPRIDPRQRLPPPLIVKFCCLRANHLAHDFARQAKLAANRFDRLLLRKVSPSYLGNRLHDQHPRPSPMEAIVNPPLRGSLLDADHPQNGVLIPHLFTLDRLERDQTHARPTHRLVTSLRVDLVVSCDPILT